MEDNLILEAKRIVLAGFTPQSHHIHLEKYIPVSSGGGGSSDVAAYLRCLAKMMALSIADKSRLFSLAVDIGADVPVCLKTSYQIMEKTGTDITPAKLREGNHYCVLADQVLQYPQPAYSVHFKGEFQLDIKPFSSQTEQHLKDVLARGNDLYRPAIQAAEIAILQEQIQKSSVASRLSV